MSSGRQRDFLVTVEGIDGFFATRTGGETSAETRRVWNGGQTTPEVMADPPVTGNVIVTRPWDPVRDQPLIKRLRPLCGQWVTTVIQQPTDRDLGVIPGVEPDVYSEARLVRIAPSEFNAENGEPDSIELEFAPREAR